MNWLRTAGVEDISIHALLAESDRPNYSKSLWIWNFYPRSPCGERRIKPIFDKIDTNFYPRSPCGERQRLTYQQGEGQAFLSTLSLRRATGFCRMTAEK